MLELEMPFLRDLEVVERAHAIQPIATDLVATREERPVDVVLRVRVADLSGLDNGPNFLIGEAHDDLRSPIGVFPIAPHERRVRIFRFPLCGLEHRGLEASDGRIVRVSRSDPFPVPDAERQHTKERGLCLPHVLEAGPWRLRAGATAAQRRAEVDEKVADEAAAAVFDEHIERIHRPGVVVVDPRRQDSQASELASVFVGKDIVRIVRTRSVIPEGAERRHTVEPLAGHGTVTTIGLLVDPGENLVEVSLNHLAFAASGHDDHRVGADLEIVRTGIRKVVLGHVEPHRVQKLGGDDLGRGAHLRIARRIELHEKHLVQGRLHRETGADAFRFRGNDGPGFGLDERTLSLIGAPGELFEGEAPPAVAVLKPAAIRYLTQRIDVERAPRCRIPRFEEVVLDEVVNVVELLLLHDLDPDGVVLVYPHRVVGVELLRVSRRCGCKHQTSNENEPRTSRHWVPSLAVRTHGRTSRRNESLHVHGRRRSGRKRRWPC